MCPCRAPGGHVMTEEGAHQNVREERRWRGTVTVTQRWRLSSQLHLKQQRQEEKE
jgi:hypothetical protein